MSIGAHGSPRCDGHHGMSDFIDPMRQGTASRHGPGGAVILMTGVALATFAPHGPFLRRRSTTASQAALRQHFRVDNQ